MIVDTDDTINYEELDVFDLDQFDRSKGDVGGDAFSRKQKKNGAQTGEDSLTMADIRGAVGGSEAIPGLSGSSDANTKSNEKKNGADTTAQDSEPIVDDVSTAGTTTLTPSIVTELPSSVGNESSDKTYNEDLNTVVSTTVETSDRTDPTSITTTQLDLVGETEKSATENIPNVTQEPTEEELKNAAKPTLDEDGDIALE
ncbi:hypothetical protein NCAS_0E04100 [Naumovozyma castellii]|uniref:Uncharacterized protein n=1 Tax=Naumovozyma castellii TaxID=27288 RepID=G0VG60_NAUCA|nr:hypothetical protein NCAS_0E04100 [Naumovozyma castellii CBS 4309]CCC70480.1 hypothetical protein NCAS_0E04100 [Naumovozyma castellii CBS 4309]